MAQAVQGKEQWSTNKGWSSAKRPLLAIGDAVAYTFADPLPHRTNFCNTLCRTWAAHGTGKHAAGHRHCCDERPGSAGGCGQVESHLWLINGVAATVPTAQIAYLQAQPGIIAVVSNRPIKTATAPAAMLPDATALTPPLWPFARPVTPDIGVDLLQQQNLTGAGVGIALVDSGMTFNPMVAGFLGADSANHFLGQADFTGNGQCQSSGPNYQQLSGYCFTNGLSSLDRYGHGTFLGSLLLTHGPNDHGPRQ